MSRIIHRGVELGCDAGRAFEMFADSKLLESWLSQATDVEPRPGGKYELFLRARLQRCVGSYAFLRKTRERWSQP
jgi:hypothetical protein